MLGEGEGYKVEHREEGRVTPSPEGRLIEAISMRALDPSQLGFEEVEVPVEVAGADLAHATCHRGAEVALRASVERHLAAARIKVEHEIINETGIDLTELCVSWSMADTRNQVTVPTE